MLIIGLTGSVASGKNFVADIFENHGFPVFDADKAVHEILISNKDVFKKIKKTFPDSIIDNKRIDHQKLGDLVLNNRKKLTILENIIHPEVANLKEKFIRRSRYNRKKAVILNIPLLFEKGGYKTCDKNIAVIVPHNVQKQRFLARMKKSNPKIKSKVALKRFEEIKRNQSDNFHKKKLADFVVNNGLSKAFTNKQIQKIICHPEFRGPSRDS